MYSEFDMMMGFDKIELGYEVHMAGFDGECFMYSIYFDKKATENDLSNIKAAVSDFAAKSESNGIYAGYTDVSLTDEKVNIFLDLGNVEPENCDHIINGILKAIDVVPNIKRVIINED